MLKSMKTKEKQLAEDELNQIVGGMAVPEQINPEGELSPEEIQALRQIADNLKPTTQNIR